MPTQWLLARTPPGGLPTAEDFQWHDAPMPEPGAGQMLTRTIYLSLDPYQWGRRRSGLEAPGEVCHGRTVSQVVKSNIPEYREGDFVFSTNGWQEYGLSGEGISIFGYMFPRKLDPAQAPISTAVGIMGMLGLTAYSGMLVQCEPRAGRRWWCPPLLGAWGKWRVSWPRSLGVASWGLPGCRRSATL